MTRSVRSSAIRRLFPVLFLAAALGAFAGSPPTAPGIDLAAMDRGVAPGDDFYAYANGAWIKAAVIPPDRSTFGPDDILVELTAKRTADLIREAAAKKAPRGSEAQMIGDYFAAYMDEKRIEKQGLTPLRPLLKRIGAIGDRTALARVLGDQLRADVDILNATDLTTDNLLGLWVAQDLDNPARYLPFLLQGGLGLPDRDYYLDPAPSMEEIRTKYRAHILAMLTLAGVKDPKGAAGRIFDLETAIARAHASRMDTGDIVKGNNHWTRADFDAKAPGLDWTTYFGAAGLGGQKEFVVWHPGAVTGVAALAASQPLGVWKEYLAFRAVEHAGEVLPKAFVEEGFAFYGTVLSGTPELRDRWKRGVDAVNDALGEAVGKLYVERYFPASEKARAQEMVRNLQAAFERRIDRLEWMAPGTREKAKAKLKVLKVGVGYPDAWTDYTGLEVRRDDAYGNLERAQRFQLRRSLAKLGRPVDRGEWVMTPQTVNAVNLPAMNAMNFPAAILQPPFFDPARPALMDYGAIGMVIGHEISHSFDDQGSLFDAEGRLNNWWTEEDLKHFQAAAERLVRQYDGYRPFPDLAVNGKLTLGENIADLAGLAASYDAYRLSLQGREAPVVEGFTGDQQFFLSFAQSWCEKRREASLRRQVLTNAHAPAAYRASTVRNVDAWYDAFAVQPGQALYLAPADRVRMW
jgi:predicted metalloendopeptidase